MNKGNNSVAFAFDLSVLVPDYEVDGIAWLDKHYEGGYLYPDMILVEAAPNTQAQGGWKLNYGYQSETPNVARRDRSRGDLRWCDVFFYSRQFASCSSPGIASVLRIKLRNWN